MYEFLNVTKDFLTILICSRYDLVKLGTQVLEDVSMTMYTKLINSYDQKNISGILLWGSLLYDLLIDMDTLLNTDRFSLLGNWIESAKALGVNDDEKKVLEFNARNQITLWGPNGEITDYANKNWAGLVKSYYAQRWKMFVYDLQDCVIHGRAFNQTHFDVGLLQFEKEWNKDQAQFPTKPSGDAEELSIAFVVKYSQYMQTFDHHGFVMKGKHFNPLRKYKINQIVI